jgi:hypothetical protein
MLSKNLHYLYGTSAIVKAKAKAVLLQAMKALEGRGV